MHIGTLKKELEVIQSKAAEFKEVMQSYRRVIIIGNGGSNSVASHIAQDYTKMLGKKAISFSDGSRLTCYINDYGSDKAYLKFIEHFWEKGTIVILISSSGNSMNIVNSAKYCRIKSYPYMALSGFSEDNKLNSHSCHFRYHVKSHDYGVVESAHLIMLHTILPNKETRGIIAGAFDVMHPGYIRMFEDAKKYCDHLTVALHEDPSTERKNKIQPVYTVGERTEILLGLRDVDTVIAYTKEQEFYDYLNSNDYDVRFLGTDYMTKEYTGPELPITIIWLARDHDYSTTKIKKMIHQSVSDMGGQEFE